MADRVSATSTGASEEAMIKNVLSTADRQRFEHRRRNIA
jgi:hypothetical protein